MDYISFKSQFILIGEGDLARECFELIPKTSAKTLQLLNAFEFAKENNPDLTYDTNLVGIKNYPLWEIKGVNLLNKIDNILEPLRNYPIHVRKILFINLLERFLNSSFDFSPAIELVKIELVNIKTQESETQEATDQPKPQKQIPDLPEIFKDKDYFNLVISNTSEYWNLDRETGRYTWTKPKTFLAGLAYQLREKNRLKKDVIIDFDVYNSQFLARVFCRFFNVKYDEKTFQPDRVTNTHRAPFGWITDF